MTTLCYDNVQPDVNGDEILEKAVADGCDVIFTTTPKLIGASLKASLAHPEVKIVNCSLNMSHPSIRTYYGRIHEAKFLLGAIADALADDNKIGYVATYSTYGMIAAINAFALGAQMAESPGAGVSEVDLGEGADIPARFAENGVTLISDLDNRAPQQPPWKFGLYRWRETTSAITPCPSGTGGKSTCALCSPSWNGGWSAGSSGEERALNYWWGMDAGVIDVLCSRTLPVETQRLVNLLRQAVCSRDFDPFAGVLYAQDGRVVVMPPTTAASPRNRSSPWTGWPAM